MSAPPRVDSVEGIAEAPLRATLDRALVPGLLLLLVALASAVVAANPTTAIWDQQALLASRFGRATR